MIAVTGATGQLGRLVIEALLESVPAGQLVAAARSPEKAAGLAARGVQVRRADYDDAATLDAAFAGVKRLLLVSSSEIGKRGVQHRAAIDAARRAGVELIVYTSVLHADTSPLGLAGEHRETEAALRESSLPHVVLRNGWYTENYTGSLAPALEHGAVLGASGDGRVSSASRVDYAAAAAAVLTSENSASRIYELAGDTSYTLAEFAAEVARLSGKAVVYRDMPEAEYKAALIGAGLPDPVAALIADSGTGTKNGALFDDSHQLSKLIGRPTTSLDKVIAAALAG